MISTIEVEKRTSEFLEFLRYQLSKNTAEQISEASGVPLETVQRIIEGTETDPKIRVLIAISSAYGRNIVFWGNGETMFGMVEEWPPLR